MPISCIFFDLYQTVRRTIVMFLSLVNFYIRVDKKCHDSNKNIQNSIPVTNI